MATKYSIEFSHSGDVSQPCISGARAESLINLRRRIKQLNSGAFTGTNTLTVRNSAVVATGTITLASCPAGQVVEVNGVPFRAVSGTPVVADGEFKRGVSDAADATSLAAAINGSTSTAISGVVTASSTGASGVVTITSVGAGYAQNAVSLKNVGICSSDAVTLSGVDANDTLSINGQALTAKQQRATGTLTAASAVAGDTCVVNGVTFTAVAGAVTVGSRQFSIDTGDTETATSLAAQINGITDYNITGKITATSAAGVVTLRAVDAGTAGNAYTLVGTAVRLAASAATLTGGIAVANNEFDCSPGSTNTQVATDLARAINASTSSLITNHVRATSAAAVVTVISKYGGLIANQITCAGSDGDISAATARLAGATEASVNGTQASSTVTISGADGGNYTVTINGVSTGNVAGTNGDDTATATSITAAINALTDAAVRGVVTASSSSGVVTITAVKGGLSGNQITLACTGTGATAGAARLASGAAPTTVVLSGDRLASGSETKFSLSY